MTTFEQALINVFAPLGRDFFLTLNAFKEYSGAIVELWEQIRERLIALAEERGQ